MYYVIESKIDRKYHRTYRDDVCCLHKSEGLTGWLISQRNFNTVSLLEGRVQANNVKR